MLDAMIYVSQLKPSAHSKSWHASEACQLLIDPAMGDAASSLDALRAFGASICLSASWLRCSKGGMPYYLLTPRRRACAVAQGAHEADGLLVQQIVERWQALKRATPPIKQEAPGQRSPGAMRSSNQQRRRIEHIATRSRFHLAAL